MPHRVVRIWCGREDSNFHGLPHSDLNAARLPIPPRPHRGRCRTAPAGLHVAKAFRVHKGRMTESSDDNRDQLFQQAACTPLRMLDSWPLCVPFRKATTGLTLAMQRENLDENVLRSHDGCPPVRWRIAPSLVALCGRNRNDGAGGCGDCAGADELVWLVEHPPLYTAGTSADAADLVMPGRFPVFADRPWRRIHLSWSWAAGGVCHA
jgi:hypothetical protein